MAAAFSTGWWRAALLLLLSWGPRAGCVRLVLVPVVRPLAVAAPARVLTRNVAVAQVARRLAHARPRRRRVRHLVRRPSKPPSSTQRPGGLDFSAGALWLSSPVEEEHSWAFGKSSFRAIVYHELGSLGARLPAPVLSPIIAAFIRELVRLDLSPLELYKVLLGELDVEAVVRLREGRVDVGNSRVGRILHDMKEVVLVVDREAEDLLLRADEDGDRALTLRELARMLGAERALDSAFGSLGDIVILRLSSDDVSFGETLRSFVMTPFLLGLERAIRAARRAIRAAASAVADLDANADGTLTLDELVGDGVARWLPAPLARAARSTIIASTAAPNALVVLVAAATLSARRALAAAHCSANAFDKSFGIGSASRALARWTLGPLASLASAARARRASPSPRRRPSEADGGTLGCDAVAPAAAPPRGARHALAPPTARASLTVSSRRWRALARSPRGVGENLGRAPEASDSR
ncbi:hypothetical protein KFE25_009477 [Diacronema lutheri]|uniref:Calmodulin n=1 Tax=Diacronema lutheri TaxID=2081491 RepID=A0A8J5XKK9_DIALT|nr:hypothetical protein KFE25_009477 [Diacronema lutheri]